jgi:hypothetical protein
MNVLKSEEYLYEDVPDLFVREVLVAQLSTSLQLLVQIASIGIFEHDEERPRLKLPEVTITPDDIGVFELLQNLILIQHVLRLSKLSNSALLQYDLIKRKPEAAITNTSKVNLAAR